MNLWRKLPWSPVKTLLYTWTLASRNFHLLEPSRTHYFMNNVILLHSSTYISKLVFQVLELGSNNILWYKLSPKGCNDRSFPY